MAKGPTWMGSAPSCSLPQPGTEDWTASSNRVSTVSAVATRSGRSMLMCRRRARGSVPLSQKALTAGQQAYDLSGMPASRHVQRGGSSDPDAPVGGTQRGGPAADLCQAHRRSGRDGQTPDLRGARRRLTASSKFRQVFGAAPADNRRQLHTAGSPLTTKAHVRSTFHKGRAGGTRTRDPGIMSPLL